MCTSVLTHCCSRYIDILTRHVLIISFHLFDIMTDVKVLETKSDWIPSLLFFFFFFFFYSFTAASSFDPPFIHVWHRQSSSLSSPLTRTSRIQIYTVHMYMKKSGKILKYIYIYILLKQYCGWLWLFLSYQTIWHTYIHLDSLVERKYILINHLLPFSPLFVETHW
jgi:hypothetical protein